MGFGGLFRGIKPKWYDKGAKVGELVIDMGKHMKNKEILIRADGNAQIGAGHLMRCLTIAEALVDKEKVMFVCAQEASAQLVREQGYEAVVLDTDYQRPQEELDLWSQLLGRGCRETAKRTILVDSYYVTNSYLQGLRAYGRVVLLEDMGKQAWDVDVIINYNAFAKRSMYEALHSPYDVQYYLGGSYIPIRQMFCNRDYQLKEQVEHVLITTGGGDCENIAGQILQQIVTEDVQYHVVTGRYNPHYAKLSAMAQAQHNIHIYHDVKDMAGLMERCDLAVTAGGTTIYELCAIGVPFVCFSYAENQELLTEYVGNQQIAGFAGAFHKNAEQTLQAIAMQIEELKEDFALRLRYSQKEQRLVDGKGAARIADVLVTIQSHANL